MNKHFYCRKGMTLVEVLIGIAILGIIVVSFVPVFSFGFIQTIRSGHKSEAQYSNQQLLEQTHAGEFNIEEVTSTSSEMKIRFGNTELNIPGKIIKVEKSFDKSETKAITKSFLPD